MYRFLIILALSTLFCLGCSNDEPITFDDTPATVESTAKLAEWNTEQENKTEEVNFYTDIDGCSCSRHSTFKLVWDAPIDTDHLIEVLLEADANGMVLCDCSHGDGADLTNTIQKIEAYVPDGKDYAGLLITLKGEVWLHSRDVDPKIGKVIEDHRYEILGDREFTI